MLRCLQLQKEFAASITGDLPDETQLRETWYNFLTKLFRKVEIEGGRTKLEEIKKQQQEEEAIYADEVCGKCIGRVCVWWRVGVTTCLLSGF